MSTSSAIRAARRRGPSGPTRAELRLQLALAAPLALQQIGLQLMGAVDTALLGRYHPDALAGSGVANALVFAITCIGMGVVMGLDALVPQALGAGEPGRARALLRDGVRVAIIIGGPATLLVVLSPLLLDAAQVDPGVAEHARIYIWARAFGVVPFLLQTALRSYLSAHGQTRPLLVAVVAGNVLNLVLDYLLIFGDAGLADLGLPGVGLPAMGVLGAAGATSAVQLLSLGVFVLAVRALHQGAGAAAATPGRALGPIVRVGTPIGLQVFAEVAVFSLTGVLAAHLSATAAAAHTVAITVASITFSIAMGIGAATAVRVGVAVGAGDHVGARRAGLVGVGLGLVVMSSSAVVFLAAPALLAGWFTDSAPVLAASLPLLQIAALFQLSDGAQAVAAGALRGAGDTRAAFIANLIGHYGVGLGISLGLAFGLGMGAPGLWWGLSAGLTVTAVALLIRFWRLTARPIARS